MPDPSSIASNSTANLINGLTIISSIAIVVIGGFIRRLYVEIEKRVLTELFEEYRKAMDSKLTEIQIDAVKQNETIVGIHHQLTSINSILEAMAVKMEISTPDQMIRDHLKGGRK